MKFTRYIAIAALGLLLAACGKDKGPAEAAIAAATSAVDGVREDGMKFAGEQFTQLEAALNSAKDNLTKGEYKAALEGAGGIAAKAQDVAKAAADKKAELSASWEQVNAGIPQMMEGLKGRLDILGQAKTLPEGLDQSKLDGLKAGYDEAMGMLEQARSAAASGDFSKAIEAGGVIKAKATEIASALGMTPAQ